MRKGHPHTCRGASRRTAFQPGPMGCIQSTAPQRPPGGVVLGGRRRLGFAWGAHAESSLVLNRALMQTYCPEMYPLMELAMADDDWCARETIESWVKRLDNIETEAFALPPDSPENNMAN